MTVTMLMLLDSLLSFDASGGDLFANPPTPLIKSSEALRLELQNVHTQLDIMKKQWQDEKRQLLGEKGVLQDAANRMNIEVRSAKQEARKAVEAERESRRSRVDTQGVRNSPMGLRGNLHRLVCRRLTRRRRSLLILRQNCRQNGCVSERCPLNRSAYNAKLERSLDNCNAPRR